MAEYYSPVTKPDLLPSYNRSREKFYRLYEAVMKQAEDVRRLVDQLVLNSSLDSAAGGLLDTIGSIVGVSRTLDFTPADGNPVLDDGAYRILIRAKAASNNWDGTLGGLQTLMDALFPEYGIEIKDCYTEDTPGHGIEEIGSVWLVLHTTVRPEPIIQDFLEHGILVPIPAGVSVQYTLPMVFEADTSLIRPAAFGGHTTKVLDGE